MAHESRHLSATAPAVPVVHSSGFAYGDRPLIELVDKHTPTEIKVAERRAAAMAEVSSAFPIPEDRGKARLSPIGDVEYVEDIGRPGRILVVAAEEGTGKSYTTSGELAIRLCLGGGTFAGTWDILDTGPVLVLSEMHADDDWQREERILAALNLDRVGLVGGYYRLDLMTAAHGKPALQSDEWCAWTAEWMRSVNAKALIVDTATAASNVDPWGPDIQEVYRRLRLMQKSYPELLVVLVVHMKKPQGRGERRISDVLGEWGRWCDVLLLMENDGASLERVKVTVRKRVRQERRFIATKRDGLLVDPEDITAKTTAVPLADVVAAITSNPGITAKELGVQLGVSKPTAQRYAAAAEAAGSVRHDSDGPRHTHRYFGGEESESELLAQV